MYTWNGTKVNFLFQNDNETGNGSVTVGLLPSLNQVSAVTSRGEVEFQLLNKVVSLEFMAVGLCIAYHPSFTHVFCRKKHISVIASLEIFSNIWITFVILLVGMVYNFLGHLSHSGDLLLWIGVCRCLSWVVR